MKRKYIFGAILLVLLCTMITVLSFAEVLTLPSGTKIIEAYAFYGDTSLDEVILPNGIEEIGEQAFGNSGLTKINLPSSLGEDSIAGNAIDPGVEVEAEEGTPAYRWAVKNGFIKEENHAPKIKSVIAQITHYVNEYGRNVYHLHINGECDYLEYPANYDQAKRNLKIYYNSGNNRDGAVLVNASSMGFGKSGDRYDYSFAKDLPSAFDPSNVYIWIEAKSSIGSDSCCIKAGLTERNNSADACIYFKPIDEATCSIEHDFTGDRLQGVYYIPERDDISGRRVTKVGLSYQNFSVVVVPEGVESIYGLDYCSELETLVLPRSLQSIPLGFQNDPNLKAIYCYPNCGAWQYLVYWGYSDILIAREGNENPLTSKIHGTISTSTGEHISNVTVTASTNSCVFTAVSRSDGTWSLEVEPDTVYAITYWHPDYRFENGQTGSAGNTLTVVGTEIAKPNITFEMDPSSITVGDIVHFSVTAPGATKVQLIVDGQGYEVHDLDQDGKVSFDRRITKHSETRDVSFIAFVDEEWIGSCDSKILLMETNGDLSKTKIEELPVPQRLGSDLRIIWNVVNNADSYRVYFYNRNTGEHTVFDDIKQLNADQFYVDIPNSILEEGYHSVSVMAMGAGYSQSESGIDLWLRPPFEEKQGWAQAEKVYTYILKDGKYNQYGWIVYNEPVRVLDQIGDYYYIEMNVAEMYGGGTARRFVKNNRYFKVGDESCRWEPTAEIEIQQYPLDDGTVKVSITVKGIIAQEAGIRLNEELIRSVTGEGTSFELTFTPSSGANVYQVYASNATTEVSDTIVIAGAETIQIPEISDTLWIGKTIPEDESETDTMYSLISTNVNPDSGVTNNKPQSWIIDYEINKEDDDNLGLGVFAVNRISKKGSVSYEFVKAGQKQANGNYRFSINPYNIGEKGYLASLDDESNGYKHHDFDYLFIPLRFAKKVGNDYYIDEETVNYLLEYGRNHDQQLAEIRRHYFINDFSDDVNISYCDINDINCEVNGITVNNSFGLRSDPSDHMKCAKTVIGRSQYYILLLNYPDQHNNWVGFAFPSNVEKAMDDAMVTSNIKMEMEKDWFGDYILKISQRNKTSSLLLGKLYLLARWKGGTNYQYSEPYDVSSVLLPSYSPATGNSSLEINLTGMFSPIKLDFGKDYEFAILGTETNTAITDEMKRQASYYYSYSIPKKNTNEKDAALRIIVYAYDHHLNALTGANINTQQIDESFRSRAAELREYISNRIASFGLNSTETIDILDTLAAAPDKERNLYLFSVWDYGVILDVDESWINPSTAYCAPALIFPENRIKVLKPTYGTSITSRNHFATTWFHESGHAADYNDSRFPGTNTTQASGIYDTMVLDFKLQVYKLANKVGLGERVSNPIFTDFETNIIANCMMDNYRGDCNEYRESFNSLFTETEQQKGKNFDAVYNLVSTKLTNLIQQYCDKYNWLEYGNAFMFSDAELGMVDNLFYVQGKMAHHKTGYWYLGIFRNNKQELEAFAEYYASRIMGIAETENRMFFPSTCDRLDSIIELAVENYREKYNSFAQ